MARPPFHCMYCHPSEPRFFPCSLGPYALSWLIVFNTHELVATFCLSDYSLPELLNFEPLFFCSYHLQFTANV